MQYFAKIIKMPFFWPKIPKFGHLGSKFEKQVGRKFQIFPILKL